MFDISYFERTLVIAAHPDDEVLGCGGTIARLTEARKQVHVLILGGVTTSRYKEDQSEESWKTSAFRDEADKAAAALKITSLSRSDFDDNRFDSVPLLDIIKTVEKAKEKIMPDLILTHDYCDLNVDHKLTHQATLTAFRPDVGNNSFRIMAFESLSNTECQDQAIFTFRPNCYVNITGYFSRKIEAMKCYKSELRKFPHPLSIEGIECLARKRGIEASCEYAEAFRIIREAL